MATKCEFQTPVNLGSEAKPDWEYSEIECDNPNFYELIESTTTGASFFLEKTFSYGDFFITFFLTVFVLVAIVKIIWDNLVKK